MTAPDSETSSSAFKGDTIAKLITPNIKEAELLSGFQIKDQEDMIKAGKKILDEGAHNVLVKGGHMQGDTIVDILLTSKDEVFKFPHKKIKIKTTHGTGCRLSCAIACNIANRIELKKAIKNSVDLVLKEIEAMHTYQS